VDHCIVVRANTVQFHNPLLSGITDDFLSRYRLKRLGAYSTGGGLDDITCWSKSGTWPSSKNLASWP